MLIEEHIYRHRNRSGASAFGPLKDWFQSLAERFLGDSQRPLVVFCYDLIQGESPEDWCRRNPGSLPDSARGRVVWVLPDNPLPRPLVLAPAKWDGGER